MLGLVLLARAASAAPQAGPAAPSPAPAPAPSGREGKGDARELMQLGVKLVGSQDYLGALAVFKDAYQRFPSAKILLNIGTTLKLLGRTAEAANAYQRYLDSSDADPARRAEVTAELAALDRGVGRLRITAPDEAEVQVGADEWLPAAAARSYRVAPGAYVVRARRKGYQPFEAGGQVAVAEEAAVDVALVAEVAPAAKPVYITVPGETRAAPEAPRARLAALLRGHFDVRGGAAGLVGASLDATERLEVHAALIAGSNLGGYAGASFALLGGSLRPRLAAGIPVFFNDGARVGLRAAAGVELVANRHVALVLEVGVEHLLNPQGSVEFAGALRTIDATSIIPALGATARL